MGVGVGDEVAWLEIAVRQAVANVGSGGGPFAAIVMRQGELLGHGVNRVTREHDPTAHAEVVAIRQACRRLSNFKLTGCVLVSSCEPCPMCLGAALWAHVDRVIFAADRDDAARGGFDDRTFYELFEQPRSLWKVPVVQIPVENPTAPFQAWQADAGRVPY